MSILDGLTSSLPPIIGASKLSDTALNSALSTAKAALGSGGAQGSTSKGQKIAQTERLFTVRSRGAFVNQSAGGDRGNRAYIKLLTSNPSAPRSGTEGGFAEPAILQGDGNPLDQAINSGSSKYGGYADFLLTGIRCSLDEKMQITETFGDGEVVYYFGRQPIMFSFSGILVDSQDNDWFTQFVTMYGHVMRGSKLAQNYELLKIVLPNMELVGTIPHMSWQQDSQNDVQIQFEFQFLAKQVIPLAVTPLNGPLSNSANLIDFGTADSFLSQKGINSVRAQAGAVLQSISNPKSSIGDIGAALLGYGHGVSGGLGSLIGPGRLSPPGVTGLSQAIDGITGTVNGVTSSITDIFHSISSNLAGVRASLFSPIYGVLSSLTKLVRSINGDVSKIFNSMISPVADIIRDVVNISSQAAGLVNLVNRSLHAGFGIVGLGDNARAYFGSLLNTRGSLSTQPWTATMSIRQLVSLGRIPLNSGFMQNQPRAVLSSSSGALPSKAALLNSGPPPTPQSGATL